MPRKQSEADQQLELYKLITEKQRIQNLRTVNPPSLPKKPDSPKTVAHSSNNSSNFQAFYLEY
jgi:LPS O-antigen subunit length determinant protein (WzzB/FepE family)